MFALGSYFDGVQRKTRAEGPKKVALTKAAMYYRRWLDMMPEESRKPEFLRSVGVMYAALENLDESRRFLELALKRMGNPPYMAEQQLYFQLAEIYMQQGDYRAALEHLIRLACARPDDGTGEGHDGFS